MAFRIPYGTRERITVGWESADGSLDPTTGTPWVAVVPPDSRPPDSAWEQVEWLPGTSNAVVYVGVGTAWDLQPGTYEVMGRLVWGGGQEQVERSHGRMTLA